MRVGSMVICCVCGLLTYDSGKTWFTTALVLALRSRGVKTCPFKPVAGHSAWSQSSTISYSTSVKMLVGDDVRNFVERLSLPPSEIPMVNPVDLLLAPHDPSQALREGRFETYFSILEEPRQVVLARLPYAGSSKHFLIVDTIQRTPRSIRERVLRLADVLGAERTRSETLMKMLRSEEVEERILDALRYLISKNDLVIIESFNDAAIPVLSLRNFVDVYVVVGPGVAAMYMDGKRVAKAIEIATYLRGEEGLRTRYVFSKLRPDAIIDIDVVDTPETLAQSRAIENIVDALLNISRRVVRA